MDRVRSSLWRRATALLVFFGAATGAGFLYVLILYYASGLHAFAPFPDAFRVAFAFYPNHPRPVLNALVTFLIALTGGIVVWSWTTRRLVAMGSSCAVLTGVVPGLSLCCSPLVGLLAVNAGLLGGLVLRSLRELTLAALIVQILLIKATIDVSRKPESLSLGRALTRKRNVLLLVLLVEIALGFELYLALRFPYFF